MVVLSTGGRPSTRFRDRGTTGTGSGSTTPGREDVVVGVKTVVDTKGVDVGPEVCLHRTSGRRERGQRM